MATDFMCELCHGKPAKRQWFDRDGRELYICQDCYDDNSSEVFEKAVAAIRDEPDEAEEGMRENGFAFFTGEMDDPVTASLVRRMARKLLEIGEANGFADMEAGNLDVTDEINSRKMDATLLFDRKHGWMTLSGKFDVKAENGSRKFCTFTLKLKKPGEIGLFGVLGESEAEMHEFPIGGRVPVPLFSIMVAMVNAMEDADEAGELAIMGNSKGSVLDEG